MCVCVCLLGTYDVFRSNDSVNNSTEKRDDHTDADEDDRCDELQGEEEER